MKTAELIAAINVCKQALGQKVIKAVHTHAEGMAQLDKLRLQMPVGIGNALELAKAQTAAAAAGTAIAKAATSSKPFTRVRDGKPVIPKTIEQASREETKGRTKPAPAARPATPKLPERLSAEQKGTRGIGEATLRTSCPALFATKPADRVSERYQFVNTWDLVKPLMDQGFVVTSVQQKRPQRGREFSMEHTRHLLRMRPSNAPLIVGEAYPELVIVNAHAGQAKLQLYTGLFRLVCLNGLVAGSVSDSLITRHTGSLAAIVEEAHRVIKSAQEKSRTVETWLKVQLTKGAALDFAKQAMTLAYGTANAFDPASLLVARRDVDKAMDLWHVFNVVQENVMRGGIEYRTANNHAAQTRGFTNLPRTVDFNARLWETAEDMAPAMA